MFPRLFSIGSFNVPTYGVLVAAGLVLGLVLIARLARRQSIEPDDTWNLGVLGILAGVLGAKILFVLNTWEYYSQHPREIFSLGVLQAGGVFSGGLVAGIAVCVWYMRRRNMPGLKTADAFAPGIALAHGIGRLGCFAAGCCYGEPTELPWGISFSSPLAAAWAGTPLGTALHPTQLYEAAVEFINFGILLWLFRRKTFDGQVMGTYLFIYGIARYFIEYARGDLGRGAILGGLITTTQLLSIGMVIAGGVLWLRRTRSSHLAVGSSR